ncbi:MAG: hypothetical protein LC776_18080 [Acidobacteria bacterium]|nr:hypothetical protein [Acidobacteriota bacterium]
MSNNTATKNWLSSNPIIALIAGAVLVGCLVTLLNRYFVLRRHVQELEMQLRLPSSGDSQRYAQFLDDLGPDTDIVRWLKHEFFTTTLPRELFLALGYLSNRWERDPTTYHDEEVATAFDDFKSAVRQFRKVVVSDTFLEAPDLEHYRVPLDWEVTEPVRYNRIVDEINATYDVMMDAYDKFLRVASAKRLPLLTHRREG